MMQAQKPTAKQKQKQNVSQNASQRHRWASVESANPMAAREAGLLNYANLTGRRHNIVQEPLDVSQLQLPNSLAMTNRDIFAQAGTHEMGVQESPLHALLQWRAAAATMQGVHARFCTKKKTARNFLCRWL